MKLCSSRRQNAALLCCFAAIVPSLSTSASHGHIDRAYTVGGIAIGLLTGAMILRWRRSRDKGNCA